MIPANRTQDQTRQLHCNLQRMNFAVEELFYNLIVITNYVLRTLLLIACITLHINVLKGKLSIIINIVVWIFIVMNYKF